MAAKQKLTAWVQPTRGPTSAAQRLAAQAASVSMKQAELKREAAERRAKRASNSDAPATSPPPKSATERRRTGR